MPQALPTAQSQGVERAGGLVLDPSPGLTPTSSQACRDFLELAETHSRKWQRALQYEQEQRIHLEETIEQLAKQHNSLERAFRNGPGLAANPNKSFSQGERANMALQSLPRVASLCLLHRCRHPYHCCPDTAPPNPNKLPLTCPYLGSLVSSYWPHRHHMPLSTASQPVSSDLRSQEEGLLESKAGPQAGGETWEGF